MATNDSTRGERPKRKAKPAGSKPEGASRTTAGVRKASDPRSERRYAPKASGLALAATVLASLGAVALGAGVYGQFFLAEPHAYAIALLGGGAAAMVLALVMGLAPTSAIRVGDAGVAEERGPSELVRIGWNEVESVELANERLVLRAGSRSVGIPLATQRQAAARALAEAKRRIPQRVEGSPDELEPLDDKDGEVVKLEPPQVAGLSCKATGKAISFEEDVRLCAGCGETYHKDHVPRVCATCNAALRAG